MNAPERITSLQNPRVKRLVGLRDRKERDATGLTLIEEPRVIQRAWRAGHPFRTVYYCLDQLRRGPAPGIELLAELKTAAAAGRCEMVELAPHVMVRASYRDNPAGLLVVAPHPGKSLEDLELPRRPLLLVLDGLEKPGNLGAVLRTADGAGVDAVLVCGRGTDLANPNTLRASTGAVFSVPTVETDPVAARVFLADRGIAVVATTPDAEDIYTEADLAGPTALVMGAEDTGLDDAWLASAGRLVRIPMLGAADSLNVGVSAALVLYEAVRQRNRTGKER